MPLTQTIYPINTNKCLFCPDSSIPSYSKWLTKQIDPHHINKRRNSEYIIPVCRYHHTLIEQNKIPKEEIIKRANKYYGKELFYLPYPESKHIQIKEK